MLFNHPVRNARSIRPGRRFLAGLAAAACLLAIACRPDSTIYPAVPPTPKTSITPEATPTPEPTVRAADTPTTRPAVRASDPLTTDAMKQNLGKPGVVRLAWTTQSELNSFAFYIMRAKESKGPFAPVNKEPIQAAGNSSTPRNYEFFDTDVKIGETYYYYMRQVDLDGSKKDITEWTTKLVVNRLNLDEATTGTAKK